MELRHLLATASVFALLAADLRAQPLDVPPPLPSTAPASAPAAPAPARPDAPKPDLQQPNPAKAEKIGPITEDEALADLPPARITAPETRIEQRRQGNRIVELTVTPAGSTRSYTIVNREGLRPLGADELSAGLSTPRFLKFDF
ncbi:MAG: hypothetical protein MUC86_08540 [Burkholderiaceae bacterium]|jgi:hypothetical protein|nr:hypothetical protein [Burkholderiaceae bacterium]